MSIVAIKPQQFASSGNYPAGGAAWNGQPRKVAWTAAEKEAGFTPNTPITAERRNALHADHYDLHSLLALKAAQEWDVTALPVAAGGRSCEINFVTRARLPGIAQDAVVAAGWDNNDSDRLVYSRSFDGTVFDAEIVGASVSTGPFCVSGGADGEFLVGAFAGVIQHTSLGGTKTTHSIGQSVAVHYLPQASRYIVANAFQSQFWYGANLASLSIASHPSGFSGFTAGVVGTPGGEFADNGGSNVVFAGTTTISGVTRFRIMSSTDQGATWTTAHTADAGITSLNVVWHAATSTFVAYDSAGQVWTSATGAGWTLLDTTVITAAAGASTRHGTLASAGHCVAKVVNPTLYTNYKGVGIAYTFDLLNWRYHYFGYGFDFTADYDVTKNPQPVLSLASINNRLFATDGFQVFRSGLFAYENVADFT